MLGIPAWHDPIGQEDDKTGGAVGPCLVEGVREGGEEIPGAITSVGIDETPGLHVEG